MALLPRYQRIGLQTRQPQQMDFAATREQARLGQNISQQVDRMSDFAFKQAAQAAEVRGQERVRDEGALPTLKAIQEGGGAKTIAERSAYALGSRVAVAEIQNEAEIEIMRILNNAERNQTPFTAVQAQLADITDGYSASIDAIDPEAGLMLQTRLSSAALKAEERYSNYYVKLQASKSKAKIGTAADAQLSNIVSNAILPGSDVNKINADIDAAAELLGDLGANEATLTAFREQTFNAAIKENTIYRFNTADLNTQAEMLTAMETKPIGGMSLAQTQTVRKSLRADYNSRLSVSKGEAAAVQADVNEQARILALGGMPSEKQILGLEQRAIAIGDLGSGARDAVGSLRFSMEKAAVYRKMTPQDLVDEVETLKLGLEGMGEAGVDTLLEAETLRVASAYLASAQQAVETAEAARQDQYKPIVDGLEQEVKDFQALVDSNQEVEVSDIVSLMERIGGVPSDLRANLPEDVQALQLTSNIATDMRDMAPAEAAGYVRSLFAGIEGIEGPGIDSPVEIQTYNLAKKMLAGMETELAKDPLSYAMRVGLNDANGNAIEITPINFSDPDATFETIQKRKNDATIVSAKYSTPVTYLTPQERSMLAEVVDQGDRSERMFLLGAIVDGFGQDAPDVLAEISKTSPEFAGIGALVASERMDAANSALRGMDAIKAGFKPIDFTPSNTDIVFNGMTTEPLRYQPNAIGITRDVATAIYADIARNKDEFDEDLWTKAIDLALGADGAGNGGIQDVRGINTYLPPELSADDVEVTLKAITPASIAAASGGQVLSEEYAESISGRGMFNRDSNYKAISYGGTNYILAYGDPSDGDPLYVFDDNDELVVFDMLKLVEAVK